MKTEFTMHEYVNDEFRKPKNCTLILTKETKTLKKDLWKYLKHTKYVLLHSKLTYEVLKDPQKRSAYDMQMNSGWGSGRSQGSRSYAEPGGEGPWSRGFQGKPQEWNYANQEEFMREYSKRYQDVMKDFHDVFQQMRGGSYREYRGPNGTRIFEYTTKGPNGQTTTQRREVHGNNPFDFMFKNIFDQAKRQRVTEIPPKFQVFESTNASYRPVLVLVENGVGIGDITQPKKGYIEWQLDGKIIAKANVDQIEDGKTRIQVMNPSGVLMGSVIKTPPVSFLKPFFESITVLDKQQRMVASGFSVQFFLEFTTINNGAGQPIATISRSPFGVSQGLWTCKHFNRGAGLDPEVFLLGGLADKLYNSPLTK